jgi:hypothetical protein
MERKLTLGGGSGGFGVGSPIYDPKTQTYKSGGYVYYGEGEPPAGSLDAWVTEQLNAPQTRLDIIAGRAVVDKTAPKRTAVSVDKVRPESVTQDVAVPDGIFNDAVPTTAFDVERATGYQEGASNSGTYTTPAFAGDSPEGESGGLETFPMPLLIGGGVLIAIYMGLI